MIGATEHNFHFPRKLAFVQVAELDAAVVVAVAVAAVVVVAAAAAELAAVEVAACDAAFAAAEVVAAVVQASVGPAVVSADGSEVNYEMVACCHQSPCLGIPNVRIGSFFILSSFTRLRVSLIRITQSHSQVT